MNRSAALLPCVVVSGVRSGSVLYVRHLNEWKGASSSICYEDCGCGLETFFSMFSRCACEQRICAHHLQVLGATRIGPCLCVVHPPDLSFFVMCVQYASSAYITGYRKVCLCRSVRTCGVWLSIDDV